MDADAFMRAICAEPENMAPRLVFADWLEEQGDPRGEFIRLQIEYAQLDESDPRRYDRLRRERELLLINREIWERMLEGIALESWVFRRGFIEEIVARADVLLAAPRLFQLSPVRRAKITRLSSEQADTLARSSWVATLRELDISWNQIGDQSLVGLLRSPHFQNLTSLDIRRNGAQESSLRELVNPAILPQLRELRVSVYPPFAADEGDPTSMKRLEEWRRLVALLRRRFGEGLHDF